MKNPKPKDIQIELISADHTTPLAIWILQQAIPVQKTSSDSGIQRDEWMRTSIEITCDEIVKTV